MMGVYYDHEAYLTQPASASPALQGGVSERLVRGLLILDVLAQDTDRSASA